MNELKLSTKALMFGIWVYQVPCLVMMAMKLNG